jgi:hypothetical protein
MTTKKLRLKDVIKVNQAIILDLDQTLVHTLDNKDEWKKFKETAIKTNDQDLLNRLYEIKVDDQLICGVMRDHIHEFISYIYSRFSIIGIYSAGSCSYVHAITSLLFNDRELDFIYARDKCVSTIHPTEGEILSKPLQSLWNKIPGMNQKNTWMVDDRHDVTIYNQLNHVHVVDYQYNNKQDTCLLELISFFNRPEITYTTDIQSILHSKNNLFNIPRCSIFID